MAIPMEAPTNQEILRTATRIAWLVVLFLTDIRKTALRYSCPLWTTITPQPRSLSDYTFVELVFITSDGVIIWSLLILLAIMAELSFNMDDAIRRPTNIYRHACILAIFFTNWMLSLGRWIALCLEFEVFMWRPVSSLVLLLLLEVC